MGRSCTSDETRNPLEASASSILARNIGSFLGWTLFPTLIRTDTARASASSLVVSTDREAITDKNSGVVQEAIDTFL